MLDSVLFVLREVLEAALFISLLLALGDKLRLKRTWVIVAVICGVFGSWLMSHFAYPLSVAFEGVGLELTNAALYLAAVLGFVVLNWLLAKPCLGWTLRNAVKPPRSESTVQVLFALIVTCSMVREGSEVWIYLLSLQAQSDMQAAALIGGFIGTGIGISIGILVYYALSMISTRYLLPSFMLLTTAVAGGLAMQFAAQLMQIGWLDSRSPLWDSSGLIDERSWFGQVLSALFGYDANPDITQAACYFSVLLLVTIGVAAQGLQWRRQAAARAQTTQRSI